MKEVWRGVLGWETLYEVSNMGRVRSLPRKVRRVRGEGITKMKIISPCVYSGYVSVYLSYLGKKRCAKLHRLIAQAFIPNPFNKPCVNHKNGIKNDNRIKNLEWCTYKENIQHAHDTGLFPVYKHDRDGQGSKLSNKTVINIKKDLIKGIYKKRDIARKHGVPFHTVYDIARGRTWKNTYD